jgi:hypothetical protein
MGTLVRAAQLPKGVVNAQTGSIPENACEVGLSVSCRSGQVAGLNLPRSPFFEELRLGNDMSQDYVRFPDNPEVNDEMGVHGHQHPIPARRSPPQ